MGVVTSLHAYKIWGFYLYPFSSYGILKFALHADSDRYPLTDTPWPCVLPCEVRSL